MQVTVELKNMATWYKYVEEKEKDEQEKSVATHNWTVCKIRSYALENTPFPDLMVFSQQLL